MCWHCKQVWNFTVKILVYNSCSSLFKHILSRVHTEQSFKTKFDWFEQQLRRSSTARSDYFWFLIVWICQIWHNEDVHPWMFSYKVWTAQSKAKSTFGLHLFSTQNPSVQHHKPFSSTHPSSRHQKPNKVCWTDGFLMLNWGVS